MRLSTVWRADRTYGIEGVRFAQGALDGLVGQTVELTRMGERVGDALVVVARVTDDGRGAEVTYEIDDDLAAQINVARAFRPEDGSLSIEGRDA